MTRRYSSIKATVIAFFMTFFSFFNIPVFWPILLLYFIALFFLTMKRQIKHMWKHNYVPWSSGKVRASPTPPAAVPMATIPPHAYATIVRLNVFALFFMCRRSLAKEGALL